MPEPLPVVQVTLTIVPPHGWQDADYDRALRELHGLEQRLRTVAERWLRCYGPTTCTVRLGE